MVFLRFHGLFSRQALSEQRAPPPQVGAHREQGGQEGDEISNDDDAGSERKLLESRPREQPQVAAPERQRIVKGPDPQDRQEDERRQAGPPPKQQRQDQQSQAHQQG